LGCSGRKRDGRTELATILDFIRPGDTLVVVKLDRLGRSTRDVLNLVHELESKGAHLRVLEPEVSTKGPIGKMVRRSMSTVPRGVPIAPLTGGGLAIRPHQTPRTTHIKQAVGASVGVSSLRRWHSESPQWLSLCSWRLLHTA
jgi:hypothetical protein